MQADLGRRLVSEALGTAFLLAIVIGSVRTRPAAIPFAVGADVTAGYGFTASTCFANPAVTLARAASNTFAGIRPEDVAGFLGAQLGGAMLATASFARLVPVRQTTGVDEPRAITPQTRESIA